jgi:hypothetical protein
MAATYDVMKDSLRREGLLESAERLGEMAGGAASAFFGLPSRNAGSRSPVSPPSGGSPVEVRRFKGAGGYEYAKLSDGSYKITKSRHSGGGQILGPGSKAHTEVAKEDPDFFESTPADQIKFERSEEISKSTPPEKIKFERSESNRRDYIERSESDRRDYMSNMIGYDRNAAKSWFMSEGGLDPENAENTVTAMERAYERESDKGAAKTAAQYKMTLQELAKLGASPRATGASYEGD